MVEAVKLLIARFNLKHLVSPFGQMTMRVGATRPSNAMSVRVNPERVVVAAEGQIVCEHARVFARSYERKRCRQIRNGEISELDERLLPKAQ